MCRATLTVSITLMSTLHQRISNIGWLTGTDRPVILPNLAVSVAAAGSADFFAGKPAAGAEWVTSSAARTPADSHVILDIAVSSLAAGYSAGVNTLVVLAGTLGPTVRVLITLSLDAASVGISLKPRQTFTHRAASDVLALSAGSTDSWLARVGSAAGSAVRAADIAAPTLTEGAASTVCTLSVGATGVGA